MPENPLLKALPPQTDYLTYLTILEYNLNASQLPTLHTVLQDTTLTTNIGWDLVHLLLPLLPASESCLQVVARLGNPREVILKITELLETLGQEIDQDEVGSDEEREVDAQGPDDTQQERSANNGTSVHPVDHAFLSGLSKEHSARPSPADRFMILVQMLSILHPRIKTKYPSRFLTTSLQAILPVYARLASDPAVTDTVISFVKTVSGSRRPQLPPRKSSTTVTHIHVSQAAPDPEAQDEPSAPEEAELQSRLLQSFLTHVMEDYTDALPVVNSTYINAFPSVGATHGLSWTSRWVEAVYSKKKIPQHLTVSYMFSEDEVLLERDSIVGQLIALARDLRLGLDELLLIITRPEVQPNEELEGFPASAADVPLSHIGALYLFAAMQSSSALFSSSLTLPELGIFPEHAAILKMFIGDEDMDGIGMQKETIFDAVLVLGYVALFNKLVVPEDDKEFTTYLQRLSLLSANIPSPTLRFQAYKLTSAILHAHPSDRVRLDFVRDTLEHCPYENLKVAAIEWLKDEILAAPGSEASPFRSRDTMDALVPLVFADPGITGNDIESHRAKLSFYLAALNFLYLICSSPTTIQDLDMRTFLRSHSLEDSFLAPLKELCRLFDVEMHVGRQGTESSQEPFRESLLLDDGIDRVQDAMHHILDVSDD